MQFLIDNEQLIMNNYSDIGQCLDQSTGMYNTKRRFQEPPIVNF